MTSPGGQEVGRISIRAVPDTSRFRRELAAKLEAIEAGLKVKIPVEPEMNAFRAKVRAATSNLPDAKVKVNVDQNWLQRSLTKLSDSFDNAFSGKAKGIPLGSLVDSAVLVAAVAAVAAPALALLSGVLISLPGLMAAVAAPAGAIALGLDGIKKSAEVLADPLVKLQGVMSSAFETRLTPIFEKLGTIFPRLEKSMPAIANGLGDIGQAFVDTVTAGPNMDKIDSIISNIGKTISDAAPGIGSFTNGLLTLADKFTGKMPGLSKMFNEWGGTFDKWVTKITTAGPDGVSPFDKAMTSLRDTVKSILDLGGDLLTAGFDFLSDPDFGKKMKEFVDGLKNLVNDVLPGLGDFFEDITKFLTETNALIDKIQGMELLKRKPEEGEKPKKGVTGSFWDPFTSEDAGWRGMVDGAKTALANLSLTVQGMFQTLWNTVKTQAMTAFAAIPASLVTSMSTAFSAIQNVAAVAFNGIVTSASAVVPQVISTFARIPALVGSTLSAIPSIAQAAFQGIVTAISSAMASAVAAVVTGAGQIVAEVQGIGAKVVAACANFGGLLVSAGAALVQGLINGITSRIGAAVAAAANLAAQVAAAARGALGIKSPSTVFAEIGANTAQGFANGLDENTQSVVEKARSLAEQITAAMNGGLEGIDAAALTDKLKETLAQLELERKGLKVQANEADALGNKDQKHSLQDQMKQIQAIKDQLSLQKDQLKMSDKFGESQKETFHICDEINKMIEIGTGFAMSNVKQFQSDIGIEGGGALTTLADIGLDWGTGMLGKLITGGGIGGTTNIQVNSIDEALTAKQTLANKQALQYTQRGP